MKPTIKQLIANIESAQEELENAILDKMDQIARRLGLTEMCVSSNFNSWICEDKEIDSEQLCRLEGLYREYVNYAGFEAIWSPERGWY